MNKSQYLAFLNKHTMDRKNFYSIGINIVFKACNIWYRNTKDKILKYLTF